MKNKKLVSKIGAIVLCAVMTVGSVVSVNAAHAMYESQGYGNKALKMETTGQTVLCKKGYKFPNSNVTVKSEYKMPQIKLGKGETFRYYTYNYKKRSSFGDEYLPLAFKSVKSWVSASWISDSTAGNLTTGFSSKYETKDYIRWTASIKGNNKCTYNLICYDVYDSMMSKNKENFYSKDETSANALYNKYPMVAVSVYDAPSSVGLWQSSNNAKLNGKTVTLKKGQTLSVYESTPKGSYANAKNVVYSSSNKGIATVTKNSTFSGSAKITAVKKGTATITVKLYNGITASVKINVK